MSFLSMLRQTGTIYRPSQTADEYGDLPYTFEELESTRLSVAPPIGPNVDLGPGEQPANEPVASFPASADVADRDVVEITAGANIGSRWRILSPREVNAGSSAVHHIEAQVQPYTGSFVLESS